MDWKNEKPATQASTLGSERREQIDDEICSLLYHFGPDRHIDGHDEISAYVCGMISAERERCAKIADGLSGDPYGTGRDIAAAIRARGAAGKD